jgi:hypothetical protein
MSISQPLKLGEAGWASGQDHHWAQPDRIAIRPMVRLAWSVFTEISNVGVFRFRPGGRCPKPLR